MHRRFVFVVLFSLALVPRTAAAQGEKPRQYVGQYTLLGSTRLVGLAGAYTAIAEGADAPLSNLASLSHRAPMLDAAFDYDFTFGFTTSPFFATAQKDFDNDGLPDRAGEASDVLLSVMLQYRRIGIGAYLRGVNFRYFVSDPPGEARSGRVEDQLLEYSIGTVGFGAAYTFEGEALLLGAGFFGAGPYFAYRGEEAEYRVWGLELDALWRPREKPYRLGLSLMPLTLGGGFEVEPTGDAVKPFLHYGGAAVPTNVSLGASMKFGADAHLYNRLSPVARRELGELPKDKVEGEPPPHYVRSGWLLLTAQLDVFAPVPRAIPVQPCRDTDGDCAGAGVARIGNAVYLLPRLGAEVEPFWNRLRIRAGSYLEPSPFPGVGPRPHVTGGFELRVYRQWAVSASIDHARLLQDISFSVGFWQ